MLSILYAFLGIVFVLFVFAVFLVRSGRNEYADGAEMDGALEGDQVNFKNSHSISHPSL